MNPINKFFLKLVLLPLVLYQRMGISASHLKAILTTKLIIDDRRPNTLHQTKFRKSDKPIKAATIGTIFISTVLGLFYLFAFAIGQDTVTQFTFYFSFFFFMLAASLISDFTAVLIDVRDNYIILPTPVNDRTIVTARILHIFIHVCKLVVPMCLPGLVTVFIKFGFLAGPAFLLMILMLTLFTIFFINALYILILKITTPQKFQAVISYVQVIFAILLYASYQVLPRFMKNFDEISFSVVDNPLLLFFPSYWFACGWNLLHLFTGNKLEWIAAAFSILLPLASLFIVVKYLAPSFNNKLALVGSTAATKEKAIKKNNNSNLYSEWLSRLFTKNGPERMGFLFSWKMAARSRDFRLKVYPSIGYLVVYVVIILMQHNSFSLEDIRNKTAIGKGLLVTGLYIGSYLPIMAINQSAFSEKFKAAWLYFTTPVKKPGLIISGSIKALILQFALPLAIIVLVSALMVIGVPALPNIFLALLNQVVLVGIIVRSGRLQLPFSLFEGNEQKTGNFIRGLGTLLISGALALLHFIIYDNLVVVIIFLFLSALAAWLLLDSIKNISWEKIKKDVRDV